MSLGQVPRIHGNRRWCLAKSLPLEPRQVVWYLWWSSGERVSKLQKGTSGVPVGPVLYFIVPWYNIHRTLFRSNGLKRCRTIRSVTWLRGQKLSGTRPNLSSALKSIRISTWQLRVCNCIIFPCLVSKNFERIEFLSFRSCFSIRFSILFDPLSADSLYTLWVAEARSKLC